MMTLSEIESIVGLTVHQVDPNMRHVLVFSKAVPKAFVDHLVKSWESLFGNLPLVLAKGANEEFSILEIKP